MGNGYNHHQSLHLQHKATFLPMLCSRPSIKDVCLPKLQDRSVSISSDPLSPKIGCMGQVKRHNKIVGFPTANKITLTAATSDGPLLVKYSKLKRIFSVKNNPTTATAATSSACRRKGRMIFNGARRPKIEESKSVLPVNIEDMDPPLPVIKKKVNGPVDGEVETIWKRRSGGLALKGLQLNNIQLNRHNLAPTTV